MRMLKTSVAILALIAAGNAAAVSSGKINFVGKVISSTCEIRPGDEDKTVTLPTVNASSLANDKDTAGTTNFTIGVVNCPAPATPVDPNDPTMVAVHFEAIGSSGFDAATGNLTNASVTDPATNVQIRLYNYGGNNSVIKLGETGNYFPIDNTTNSATTTYTAGYYATGTSTAGNVQAHVMYSLAYK
ncbi:fimbrial protein [Candidatus Pantoea floridensis]|uniref:Major type 1 subunit fimbrin (Pilin) n=1 Tax=Candidatus Pantoea floridensis TaxID=1938870 RepID=A0A286BQB2_9GAMM|nr:fimbrial protein [Pantoea floridensis]PIF22979.1 major type 1 subunit fimbrin (pilin) [Enterobacteriaceae bacterium JKS000233]SOD36330.1 major type 1 subunit fimbrin (pilin) [Pantoea floridensis]